MTTCWNASCPASGGRSTTSPAGRGPGPVPDRRGRTGVHRAGPVRDRLQVAGPAADPDRAAAGPSSPMADLDEFAARLPRRGTSGPARATTTTGARSATPDGCCSTSASSTSCPDRAARSRFAERLADVPTADPRPTMVAYLDRKPPPAGPRPCRRSRPGSRTSAGSSPTSTPDLASLAALDRRRHIEPYLTSLVDAVNSKTGEPISVADRPGGCSRWPGFLDRHHRMGLARGATAASWCSAPTSPSCPAPLPRYLPVDVDRRLTAALHDSPRTGWPPTRCCCNAPAGCAIGELLDLELDCVHEIPGHGSLAEGPAGQARHRTDGAPGRGDRRP